MKEWFLPLLYASDLAHKKITKKKLYFLRRAKMEKFNTEICKVDYDLVKKNDIEGLINEPVVKKAADLLRVGQLVAFPTETVYGLGADATNEHAVEKIYLAKGRPQDNPLIVHITTFQQLNKIVRGGLSNLVRKMIDNFWPGPLTIILNKGGLIPDKTTAGLDSVAVRMPSHPLIRALIETAEIPIAAPSANRSGAPSPTRVSHVINDLQGKIPLILDGGPTWFGVESTVVDLRNNNLRILRPGGVTKEEIQGVLDGDIKIFNLNDKSDVSKNSGMGNNVNKEYSSSETKLGDDIVRPISPGMKYRHYSPDTPLYIVENEQVLKELIEKGIGKETGIILSDETYEKYSSNLEDVHLIKMGSRNRPEIIAANLFELLRSLDKLPLESAYIEAIPQNGIGEAVMNRLYKASSKE